MPVMPPERPPIPWWALIGPGLSAVLGLFLLTVVFFGAESTTPIQLELGYSTPTFLLSAVVAYLVGAAITFPLGLVLGHRATAAILIPAAALMLIGVLLTAFASAAAMLLISRLLTGLAAGAAIGTTIRLLTTIRGQRATATTATAAAGLLAAATAPFVNQLIATEIGFRITFLAAAPVAFVVLLANIAFGIMLYATNKQPAQAYVPSTTRR